LKSFRKYNGAIIPDIPPDMLINYNEAEIKSFMKNSNALFARWESDFDCKEITDFWFLINDTPMNLEDYDSRIRNQIRKGLKECIVEPITSNQLISYGYDVYFSVFNKYKTYLKAKTKDQFIEEIISTASNWEYWGVFYKKRLIGYSKVMVVDDYAEYRSIKLHPHFLKNLPSEALIYTMNYNYLNKRKFRYVNNGARSISHQTNFPLFLIRKFKFRRAYCKLNIIYSSKLSVFVKLFFPFRRLFKLFNFGLFRQLNILLKQELIRRSFN